MSTATTAARSAHVEAVQSLYEAFGRGDIPGILELLSEDVRWGHWADPFAQRHSVDWLTPRAGHDGATESFGVIGQFDISEFAVLDITASDTQVVAEVVIDAKIPGGGHSRDEELHLWGFDAAGKINRMRHYVDTAKHIAAAQGEETVRA